MALEKELETYEKELMAQEGKYVLVRDGLIAGIWETYEDGLHAGYSKFGLKPFLLKKIQGIEQVHAGTFSLAT